MIPKGANRPDTGPAAERIDRLSWCWPAKLTILLLWLAGLFTLGCVATSMWLDPNSNVLSVVGLTAWNVSPYLALSKLARGSRAKIRDSIVLLLGSSLIAAPGILTFLFVIASSSGLRGDGQAGLWLIVFPILQWFAIGVVSLSLLAFGGERGK